MSYREVRAEAKASRDSRQRMYARGGAVDDAAEDRKEVAAGVHKHEAHLHKGEPKTKLRDGGAVEGRARGGRADRPKHGGKTEVNVVVPPSSGEARPVPVPVPVAGGMPRPPMPPPGGAPGGPPIGGMGPMPGGPMPGMMPPRARGGRMTAGAASGEGRIEKAEGKR